MSRILIGFALVNWIAALVIIPFYGLASGALKLRVMSSYNQLRENGVINEEKLARVGWEKLPGTDLQKAHQYFLGSVTSFYTATAWCVSVLLVINGGVFFFAYRTLQRPSRLTEDATRPVSGQKV